MSLIECTSQLLVSKLRLLGNKGIMVSDSGQFPVKKMHTRKHTHTEMHTEMSAHTILILTYCNECYSISFLAYIISS